MRSKREIRALHPYEVPEITAMKADKGPDAYRQVGRGGDSRAQ